MKINFLAILLASCVVSHQADAAISITSFNLTTESVTFDIFGTLPNNLPVAGEQVLVFINPIPSPSPRFVVFTETSAISQSFTSLQVISFINTGNALYGDYFYLYFVNPMAGGETLSGTLTGTWSGTVFDPSAINNLNVYWGASSSVTDGTFLTNVSIVPEPSAALLAAFGTLALLRRPRK